MLNTMSTAMLNVATCAMFGNVMNARLGATVVLFQATRLQVCCPMLNALSSPA